MLLMMSRVDSSSVFLRILFRRRGYLVSLWWGFATMSASFRRLHCLCVSPHCGEPDKHRKWNIYWPRKKEENSLGVCQYRQSCRCLKLRQESGKDWPWRRSWRAHCPCEACACTPCSPPPPCSNGCRAETWSQTEHTHTHKDNILTPTSA